MFYQAKKGHIVGKFIGINIEAFCPRHETSLLKLRTCFVRARSIAKQTLSINADVTSAYLAGEEDVTSA